MNRLLHCLFAFNLSVIVEEVLWVSSHLATIPHSGIVCGAIWSIISCFCQVTSALLLFSSSVTKIGLLSKQNQINNLNPACMKPNQPTDMSIPQQSTNSTIPQSALPLYEMLSSQQLIENLHRVINEQERKIVEFQRLLTTYMERIKGLSHNYEQQRAYSRDIFEKLEQARNQNYRLKVQIGLVKSDNLILKSKLGYQESGDKFSRDAANSDRNGNQQKEEEQKQKKIKSLQTKMASFRKIMKQLMKTLEKIIINNQGGENDIIDQIGELMRHIK